METVHDRALVWFRRDLRDFDHAALHHALAESREVHCAFVFDREILDVLPSRRDRRVEFIVESVRELDAALKARGGALIVRHAVARDAIPRLAMELHADAVYWNRDHEPGTRDRDDDVSRRLDGQGIAHRTFKDHLVFERDELRTQSGRPYTVFTPYWNAWQRALTPSHLQPLATDPGPGRFAPDTTIAGPVPTLAALGFEATDLGRLRMPTGMSGGAALFADFRDRIAAYRDARDYPAVKGPSYLSAHLRFGTVSIRELARFAYACSLEADGAGAATWLKELGWRDFYAQLLWHHPHVAFRAFRPEYDALRFPGDPAHFDAWREGRTGYPIVDAAMRQLSASGYMHNRLRMIVASFLVKDLLLDWRQGERHFADTLLDFDLASNNGGWQWAASTGCDAQPWFRIFNPVTQSERFDPEGEFIRRYVPELAGLSAAEIHAPWQLPPSTLEAKGIVIGRDYAAPIVDHASSRERALALFRDATGRA